MSGVTWLSLAVGRTLELSLWALFYVLYDDDSVVFLTVAGSSTLDSTSIFNEGPGGDLQKGLTPLSISSALPASNLSMSSKRRDIPQGRH
jgi:hypothetical protein